MQETGPSAAARPLQAVGGSAGADEPGRLEFNRRDTALRLHERVAHLESTTTGVAALERDAALARVDELEAEAARLRKILDSRGGRWLRAIHAARSAKPQPV